MIAIKTSLSCAVSLGIIGWVYKDDELSQVLIQQSQNLPAVLGSPTTTSSPSTITGYIKSMLRQTIESTVGTGTNLILSGAKVGIKAVIETGQEVFEDEVGASVSTVKDAVIALLAVTALVYTYSKLSASNQSNTEPSNTDIPPPTVIVNVSSACSTEKNNTAAFKSIAATLEKTHRNNWPFFSPAKSVTDIKTKKQAFEIIKQDDASEQDKTTALLTYLKLSSKEEQNALLGAFNTNPETSEFLLEIIKDQLATNQEIQTLMQKEEPLFAPGFAAG
ncbi:MAG: hypothetical protein K0U24_02335 [Gammaproteobacteria bacterium]|nr:hypothetical protein [Gammaproteobacteria bacterium]